tara:strand:+ start:15077 stop:15286 length:210 start_codon:yes stop_codon:yes gene_type:complete
MDVLFHNQKNLMKFPELLNKVLQVVTRTGRMLVVLGNRIFGKNLIFMMFCSVENRIADKIYASSDERPG